MHSSGAWRRSHDFLKHVPLVWAGERLQLENERISGEQWRVFSPGWNGTNDRAIFFAWS
jgi:hypothetical protein